MSKHLRMVGISSHV